VLHSTQHSIWLGQHDAIGVVSGVQATGFTKASRDIPENLQQTVLVSMLLLGYKSKQDLGTGEHNCYMMSDLNKNRERFITPCLPQWLHPVLPMNRK
jgi:hypothetical protein